MRLRILKGIQLMVAIAITLATGAGWLWPGVMALFVMPAFLLYVIWTVRAAFNHRLSVWLALLSTTVVAVLLGALGVSMVTNTFRSGDPRASQIPLVALSPQGVVVRLPPEALPELRRIQAEIDRRERLHASVLLLIGIGAWVVMGLHVMEWQWACGRRSQE
jgi:predicted PurR-regulated permease PerM